MQIRKAPLVSDYSTEKFWRAPSTPYPPHGARLFFEIVMEAPKKLKGKEFETEIIDAANRHRGLLKLGRYGTSARYDADGNMKAMKSNPDIEGTLAGAGRHIITECKVTSAKSLYLASRIKDDKADKQLKFMLAHAELGAICFYSIHFNARELKKGEVPAESWLMPVHQLMPYWAQIQSG